jgi:creatinine amidohydrolase
VIDLGLLTSTELADAPAVLLLPLGAMEQHGPHLPLDTDMRIATAVARAAAARLRPVLPVVVAPALAYGSSGEHAGFAGTLSIGNEALELVLVELGRSAGPEFRHVLLVNGHGGNHQPVSRAVTRLRRERRSVSSWSPRLAGSDAHAGYTETSLLLALAPELVHMDRAVVGDARPLQELMPLLRHGGVAAVSANGVLGDPTGADPAAGAQLFEELVEQLQAAVLTAVQDEADGSSRPPGGGLA